MPPALLTRSSLLFPVLAVLSLAVGCGGGAEKKKGEATNGAKAEGGDDGAKEGDGTAAAAAETGAAPAGETGMVDPPADGGGTDGAEPHDPQVVEVTKDTTIGVELCDAYIASYVACIDEKMPEADREKARKALGEQVAAWKQTVDNGGATAAVEIGCKTATAKAKGATKDLGCAFGDAE